MKHTHCLSIILTGALICAQQLFAAQDIKPNAFRPNDKVCFVGDSITAGGYYTEQLMLYYATRFPNAKFDFNNLGVSGDSAAGINSRMNWDILPYKPDVFVLMVGMNDVRRSNYTQENKNKPGHIKRVLATRSAYQAELAKAVDTLSSNARAMIIFTPSIFDQTSDVSGDKCVGINDELVNYGGIAKKLAVMKNNAAVVDMSKATLDANARYQAAEGSSKTFMADRVHPRQGGGLAMAGEFVKTFKESEFVSALEINAKKRAVVKAFNCDVSNLSTGGGKMSFTLLEYALPFPITKETETADKYVEFRKKFDREMLTVSDLPKGSYSLSIDGKEVGKYSDKEFAAGVNLAENDKTPQFAQAMKVAKLCELFRTKAAEYRNLFYVEMASANVFKNKTEAEKMQLAKAKAEEMDKSPSKNPFVVGCYRNYAEKASKKPEMFADVKKVLAEIYAANKPVAHNYVLTKAQ